MSGVHAFRLAGLVQSRRDPMGLVISAANIALRGRADNRAGLTLTWPDGSVRMDARAVARRRTGRRARAPARGSLSGAAGARGRWARLPAVRAGDRDRT